jgi:hypothetical protein
MSFIEICDVHTGKFILFPAPAEMVCIGRYRSHHVVSVFKDGRVDHNDWTLRFLDGYTGPTVSRWDRVLHIESGQTSHRGEFLKNFQATEFSFRRLGSSPKFYCATTKATVYIFSTVCCEPHKIQFIINFSRVGAFK